MGRYPHYLYQVKGGRFPARVVCVAVDACYEAIPGIRQARREILKSWHAVVLTRKEQVYAIVCRLSGKSESGFWRHLRTHANRPGALWLYSHQCARVWSLLGLWGLIECNDVQVAGRDHRSPAGSKSGAKPGGCGYLVLEDPPCVLSARFTGQAGRLHWVDCRNYGVEPPDGTQSGGGEATWLAHQFSELTGVVREYNLGSLQSTAGSQALHGYRAGYMQGTIYVHNHQAGLSLEERSYHGGRCEAYRLGDVGGAAWHLDFRSLYPSICSSASLPVRLSRVVATPSVAETMRYAQESGVIADVELFTEEPAYPVRDGKITIFPVGYFRAVLPGPELVDALAYGRVLHVHEIALYQSATVLQNFATRLYALRCGAEDEGNRAKAALAKRLLVSLPGKFGQRDRRWVWTGALREDRPYEAWEDHESDGSVTRYRAIAWHIQKEVIGGFSADSVPALAAWILSAGRMRLLTAIRVCGWGDVYYVDTDSLFVSQHGYDRLRDAGLVVARTLGQLEVRAALSPLTVRGIKQYTHGHHTAHAGLPRGEVVDTGDGWHYWCRESPAESIRRGRRPDLVGTLGKYQSGSVYRHGFVQPDGRVTPWRLPRG